MPKIRRKALARIGDIYDYLARLDSLVTFIGPSPFGCLGLETYVNKISFVTALDCVGGLNRATQTPADDRIASYETAAQTCNEMLRHKEVQAYLRARGEGFLWPQAANAETFELAKSLAQTVLAADGQLLTALSNDSTGRDLLAKSGINFVPQAKGTVSNYAELQALAQKAKLGDKLVVQTGDGQQRRTYFIDRERNWSDVEEQCAGQMLTVSRYMNHVRYRVDAVVTPQGPIAGPVMRLVRMVGAEGAVAASGEELAVRSGIQAGIKKIGNALLDVGFVGACDCTFYHDTATDKIYLKRIRPGFSAFSQLTHLLTTHHGGLPLASFHLLANLGIDTDVDFLALQRRWQEHATWSALVLTHSENSVDFITKSPASAIYNEAADGQFDIALPSINPLELRGESECVYLRLLGTGTYRQLNLQLGIVIGRGDAFKTEKDKESRAMRWARGFSDMYSAVQMSGSSLPSRTDGADTGLF